MDYPLLETSKGPLLDFPSTVPILSVFAHREPSALHQIRVTSAPNQPEIIVGFTSRFPEKVYRAPFLNRVTPCALVQINRGQVRDRPRQRSSMISDGTKFTGRLRKGVGRHPISRLRLGQLLARTVPDFPANVVCRPSHVPPGPRCQNLLVGLSGLSAGE